MKIALDPYMHRHVPLLELPRFVADLGYEFIELSPRADFLNWWVTRGIPRAHRLKKALGRNVSWRPCRRCTVGRA
jgi:myo-inositol catabolism protein IolH